MLQVIVIPFDNIDVHSMLCTIDEKESPEKRKNKERKAVSQTVSTVGSTQEDLS